MTAFGIGAHVLKCKRSRAGVYLQLLSGKTGITTRGLAGAGRVAWVRASASVSNDSAHRRPRPCPGNDTHARERAFSQGSAAGRVQMDIRSPQA